jgi:hypothetical protein
MLSIWNGNHLTPISNKKPYTEEDAMNMYNDNKDEFGDIAQIILANDLFFENEYYRESSEGATSNSVAAIPFYSNETKKYFSQEEWHEISEFFNNTEPYEIARYENSVIVFDYLDKNNRTIYISFFHFGNYTDFIYRTQFYSNVLNLGNDWYFAYGSKFW